MAVLLNAPELISELARLEESLRHLRVQIEVLIQLMQPVADGEGDTAHGC